MQTGITTPDTLAAALRSVSQKRKHAVLNVHRENAKLEILCANGKVVDIRQEGSNYAEEVERRLRSAGIIPDSMQAIAPPSYAHLFRVLESAGLCDLELFNFTVRHRVLDALYMALSDRSGGYFSVDTKMVEYESAYCPSLSVGQLLLDLVALASDYEHFKEHFPDDLVVCRLEGDNLTLSLEERRIYSLLIIPSSVAELRHRSLLSAFSFQDSLGTMRERGIICKEAEFLGLKQAAQQSASIFGAPEADAQQRLLAVEPDAPLLEQPAIKPEIGEVQLKSSELRKAKDSALVKLLLTDNRVPQLLLLIAALAAGWGGFKGLAIMLQM